MSGDVVDNSDIRAAVSTEFIQFFSTGFSNTSQVGARFLPATLYCFFSICLFWFSNCTGWNTSFLLGWPIFSGYVSFRECRFHRCVCVYIYMYVCAFIFFLNKEVDMQGIGAGV